MNPGSLSTSSAFFVQLLPDACTSLPEDLLLTEKAVLSQRGVVDTALIIWSWCRIRVGLLLFILARRRVLRRHHQEHHASAQFFGELGGTLVQFEADPVG